MGQAGRAVWALALSIASSSVACGHSTNGATGGGLTARFRLSGDTPPGLMDVPFPTDAYLANGRIVDPIPGVDRVLPLGGPLITHELGKLDGFGRSTFSCGSAAVRYAGGRGGRPLALAWRLAATHADAA